MRNFIRWNWKVAPLTLAAAAATAVVFARPVAWQLSNPVPPGAMRPLGNLGWVEVILLALPVVIAAGGVAGERRWQLGLLTISFVGLVAGMLGGLPFWLDLHSPGFELIFPAVLVAVALTLRFRGDAHTDGPPSGFGQFSVDNVR